MVIVLRDTPISGFGETELLFDDSERVFYFGPKAREALKKRFLCGARRCHMGTSIY